MSKRFLPYSAEINKVLKEKAVIAFIKGQKYLVTRYFQIVLKGESDTDKIFWTFRDNSSAYFYLEDGSSIGSVDNLTWEDLKKLSIKSLIDDSMEFTPEKTESMSGQIIRARQVFNKGNEYGIYI